MNKKVFIPPFALALFVSFAGAANCQQASSSTSTTKETTTEQAAPVPKYLRHGSRIAADGSDKGDVAAADREKRREHVRQRMLERFDANHNGVLDPDEKAKMEEFKAKMKERRQEREKEESKDSAPAPATESK